MLRSPAFSLLTLLGAGAMAMTTVSATVPPAVAQEVDPDKEYFDRSRAVWESFPREAVKGSRVPLKFRIGGGHFGPNIVVVYPDGRPVYLVPEQEPSSGYWVIEIPLDKRGGRHRVSLVVDSKAGDRLAAQFFLFGTAADGSRIDRDVEIPPADTVYENLDAEEHPLRLERILANRMNAFRVANGLAPLPWHEGVARAAREHIPEMAQLYEDSYDARVGWGTLVHKFPEDGDRPVGPAISDRVRLNLGWTVVTPKLGPDDPQKGRNATCYVSESLLSPDSSLDRKFEQTMLRVSEHRAPMLQRDLTHVAGAALWRTYMPQRRVKVVTRKEGPGLEEKPALTRSEGPEGRSLPSNRKEGEGAQAFSILVFVQINDTEVMKREEQLRRDVLAAPGREKEPERRAEALRTVGRYAFPESSRFLRGWLEKDEPEIRAAALDGLWLCDPAAARDRVDTVHLRIERAGAKDEFDGVAADLQALPLVQYDAATRREGVRMLKEIRRRGRDAVDEAVMKSRTDAEGARAELLRLARAYRGLPEGEDAADALRALPAEGGR